MLTSPLGVCMSHRVNGEFKHIVTWLLLSLTTWTDRQRLQIYVKNAKDVNPTAGQKQNCTNYLNVIRATK